LALSGHPLWTAGAEIPCRKVPRLRTDAGAPLLDILDPCGQTGRGALDRHADLVLGRSSSGRTAACGLFAELCLRQVGINVRATTALNTHANRQIVSWAAARAAPAHCAIGTDVAYLATYTLATPAMRPLFAPFGSRKTRAPSEKFLPAGGAYPRRRSCYRWGAHLAGDRVQRRLQPARFEGDKVRRQFQPIQGEVS
jgi:hypothetical protein